MGVFGTSKMKLFGGSEKIRKAYLGTEKIYSAGSIVTYYVDSNTYYQEEVDSDASCLNPTTFTPSKSGWTFVGWREDTVASSDVLSSKVMCDEPITLYAVFKQDVKLTYYDNSTTPQYKYSGRYYNNGTQDNPAWFMAQSSKDGWTARGWTTGTAGNASVAYNNSTYITITKDTTIYGLYEQSVACNFISYNKTETKYATRYYNSYGNTLNGSVTAPTGASYSGWSWRGWSHNNGTGATLSPRYANGATVPDISATENHYGLYEQTIYLYYNGNGSTSGSVSTQSGTRYYNAYGNTSNPSFKLASNGYSRSNASFLDWAWGSVGGTRYAAGATVTLSSSTTFYAKWRVSVQISASASNVELIAYPNTGTQTKTAITLSTKYGGAISGTVAYTATGGSWRGDGWPASSNLYITSNPSGISTHSYGSWQGAPTDVSASMSVNNANSVSIIWSLPSDSGDEEEDPKKYGFRFGTQTLTATEVYVA